MTFDPIYVRLMTNEETSTLFHRAEASLFYISENDSASRWQVRSRGPITRSSPGVGFVFWVFLFGILFLYLSRFLLFLSLDHLFFSSITN